MTRHWWLAMGGNLGDVVETLHAAELQLAAHPQIKLIANSRRFQTAPVGANAGTPFLNSAVEITTDLEPLALLDYTQGIENGLGRVRTLHWGPRTLDIDLLFAAPAVVQTTPRLTLPHPHFWYRRFVLEPLCDILGDLWLAALTEKWRSNWGIGVYSSTASPSQDEVIRAVAERFPHRHIEAWTPGQPRPELLAVIGDATGIKPLFLSLPDNVPTATQALIDAITAAEDTPVPVG